MLALVLVAAGLYVAGIALGWYGQLEDAGEITAAPTPSRIVDSRARAQREAAGGALTKQILFGDLHVHTTFSSDAFRMTLPMVQGEGAHPPADACDYARACSGLDFWALTDHAESLTPEHWVQSQVLIRHCNALAGDSANPDTVAFLGFEWTQAGATPELHYGHKNVIFRDVEPDRVPARPIGSAFRAAFGSIPLELRLLPPLRDLPNRQRYYDFDALISSIADVPPCAADVPVRELPQDCAETASTPAELFAKLADWGYDSIVIPHGTTWGVYSPAGTALAKQLTDSMHDPMRQTLFEVFSGHGNSEEYRDWRAAIRGPGGELICPEPSEDYLPSCWRAGEIIRGRCEDAGLDAAACDARAAEARARYLQYGVSGWHAVPGTALTDWLDAGQCRDCYLPSFNYRPGGSAQYALAIGAFEGARGASERPARFRFGFVASSDNHSARPGTGFKEAGRGYTSDWWGYRDRGSRELYATDRGAPEPRAVKVDPSRIDLFNILEMERQASFFYTGGLVAAHADGRDRDAIWRALERKEVYGTSGERILLWFELIDMPQSDAVAPMGAEVRMRTMPRFRARAVGAFEQAPGCPEHALGALPSARLERLCRGECYNPTGRRKLITRIDVIRVRPQVEPREDLAGLIEDPWVSFECPPDPAGCAVEFEDAEFVSGRRDSVYYVRAVQESVPTINADNLRCERGADGQCLRVYPCYGDDRTAPDDDCLAPATGRAWSSPIFVDYAR